MVVEATKKKLSEDELMWKIAEIQYEAFIELLHKIIRTLHQKKFIKELKEATKKSKRKI